MVKRQKVILKAYDELDKIEISCLVELGSITTPYDHERRITKLKDGLFDQLRNMGFHCHQIEIL